MFQTYFSLWSSKSWNQFLLVLQIQIAKNSCYILILFTMQPTSPSYESDASDTQLNYFTYHQFLFKLIPIILTFIVIQNDCANSGNAEHHVRGSTKGTLTGSKFSIQIWFVHISSTLQPLGTKWRRFCTNVNKIARGPHLGNPKHHVRGSLLLLGCLLIKSMLFLSFWIESVSSVCINCVSHYFYELMFIFFIGVCCHEVSYFVLTTSNMYMMELADSIKHLNFYAIGFSHVSPICEIANVCRSSDLNSGT